MVRKSWHNKFHLSLQNFEQFSRSLRNETKRLGALFEMLDSPLYRSFIKTLEDEVSKKDDQLRFRRNEISLITHVIVFQEEEIHKTLGRRISSHPPKIEIVFRWLLNLNIRKKKVRVPFCPNLTLTKFFFFPGGKKVALSISHSWKNNLSVISGEKLQNFTFFESDGIWKNKIWIDHWFD